MRPENPSSAASERADKSRWRMEKLGDTRLHGTNQKCVASDFLAAAAARIDYVNIRVYLMELHRATTIRAHNANCPRPTRQIRGG